MKSRNQNGAEEMQNYTAFADRKPVSKLINQMKSNKEEELPAQLNSNSFSN